SEQGAQFPGGKWTCYDMGLHVAMVVRWPRQVRAGSVSDAMVQHVDVVPTLLEAAGGQQVKGLDGKSFLGVLQGRTDKHHDMVFGVHTTRGIINGSPCYPIRSVRTATHKYIWNPKYTEPFRNVLIGGGDKGGYWKSWVELAKTDEKARRIVEGYQRRSEVELYDLRSDPFEQKNLAGTPGLQELEKSLRSSLDAWMLQQGDKGIETELKVKAHRSVSGEGKKAGKAKDKKSGKRKKASAPLRAS
ncbi:MAG: sulfatase/phosphatase domain-containing protein, partial [Planctomycetota bacterium]|nr:sulfatase/phosphatase domain-containing protein [Planctomycetota bacterium]